MQHKWTDSSGIKHNFCIKCGIKKSLAFGKACIVTKDSHNKNLEHDLVPTYNNSSNQMMYKCKKCGVDVNKRWSMYPLVYFVKGKGPTPELEEKVLVPYIEKFDINGTLKSRACTTVSKYMKNKWKNAGKEIKYMQIHCAYTEEQVVVKSIIL